MKKLIYNPAQILTINTNGNNLKRGKEQSDVGLLENHSIEIENGIIKYFIRTDEAKKENYDEVIDVSNKVILPGLVECHTHTTFAGSRADEFRMKLEGIDYEEIAKKGGGRS